MARKKSDGGSPILVIFLVLFILLSIGLGVMYYTGLKQIDTANDAEKKAKTDLAAAQKAQEIAEAKVKLYKAFVGVGDKNDLDALKSPVPNARAELEAEHKALVGRANELLAMASADVSKGADAKAWEDLRKKFNLTPQETFTWDWPAGGGGLAGGPTPTLLNRLVTVVAERERTFLEALQKQENAAAQGEEFKKAKKEYTDALATLSTQVQEQIKKLEVAIGKVEEDKRAAIETFEKTSDTTRKEIAKRQGQLDEAGILLNEEKAKLANIQRQLQGLIDRQNELEESRRGAFVVNVPHGEITRRTPSDQMVEINIGSSAGLKRGQTFIVQPASARREGLSRRTKPGTDELVSKGAVEVVEVLGPNLASARITAETDDIRDSILKGDLLYNPLFKKNAQDHVVLVGIFDTDADGIDDIATVARDLAKRGAIVDGYFDLNSGKWESPDPAVRRPGPGPNTTYVVRGWEFGVSPGEPEALGRAKGVLRDQLSAALTEAKTKGAQEMRANRFLAEIGYPFSQSISDETVSSAAVKYVRDTVAPPMPK